MCIRDRQCFFIQRPPVAKHALFILDPRKDDSQMTSLAIVLAVMAFVAMRRARRCRGYYGYGWCSPFGHGWHGHHGWHSRRHARARMMLHGLFMRIDACLLYTSDAADE